MRCPVVAPMLALVALPLSLCAQADSNLTVHGYLTQGVARASHLPIHGIPAKEATTDYRSAVLQFRYQLPHRCGVTFQLGHRRYGISALNVPNGATVIDVAYLQCQSPRIGALSVGRLQLPLGIYRGTRDVGVLLPFYRAPSTYYAEGFRALDGVQLDRTQSLGDWTLETTLFTGGIDVKSLYRLPGKPEQVFSSRLERAYGAHVDLITPLEGLTVSTHHGRFRDLDQGPGSNPGWYSATGAGLNYTRSRGFLRSEGRRFLNSTSTEVMYYGQAGVSVTPKLSLNGQAEFSHINQTASGRKYMSFADRAGSLRYAVRPNLVLTAEHHQARGYQAFNVATPNTGAPGFTAYNILSVSASF